jgi:hypothetical protein
MLKVIAETDLVEILKPRKWLTCAVTVAALLWVAPASAGLVHNLADTHGSTRNISTITLHQPSGKGSNRVRSPRSRGGPVIPPPPVSCTDTTPIPVTNPVTPPRQRGGHHTRDTKSSDTIVSSPDTVVSATTAVPVAPAAQKVRQPRGTRSSRNSGPPVVPVVTGPNTCPTGDDNGGLVVDVPTGDGTSGDGTSGPTINPPTIIAAPEPASLLVFGSGIAAVVAYRRRRKSAL